MKIFRAAATAGAFMLAVVLPAVGSTAAAQVKKEAVLDTYANIALAMYEDALSEARKLQAAVDKLIAEPSQANLDAARKAWLAARVPYQQTEVYRFGNKIVDDWEGKVNAWPLDEGLIDYVDTSYGTTSKDNPLYTANVIANKSIKIGNKTVDTSTITKKLLSETLHEAGGVEANVATGYHAIEFLLWGQDLNGTGKGAGNRPWTDYGKSNCTHGNCDRRGQYLKVATDLLVDDLTWMVAQWKKGGAARAALTSDGADKGLSAILTGMGSLSYGELAGERMKLGLMLHDPEEEHDCFSDNTHNSHYYNVVGMTAVWNGSYRRVDGSVVSGPSPAALVRQVDAPLAKEMSAKLATTLDKAAALKKRAETTEAYDQMLVKNNAEGNATVDAMVEALKDQTKTIEKVVARLKLTPIKIEGSDSLDDPAKVFE